MRRKALWFLLLTVLVAGCSPNTYLKKMMDRIVPDDDDAFARTYLETVRSRDFDTAISQLAPQFVKAGIKVKLAKVATFLDQGTPVSIEIVGCNVFSSSGKRRSNLTYQYHFTNSWLLASVVVDTDTVNNQKQVFGMHVNPIPKSLKELNAFTISGKGVQNYAMLMLAMLVPLFILYVLVVCIRTNIRKRKWLWIIFILLGLGKLSLNWTSGQILFNPLSFHIQLFGAAVFKPGPLGAILFLMRRKQLQVATSSPSLTTND